MTPSYIKLPMQVKLINSESVQLKFITVLGLSWLIYNYFMFSPLVPHWVQECCTEIEDAKPTKFRCKTVWTAWVELLCHICSEYRDGIFLFIAYAVTYSCLNIPQVLSKCVRTSKGVCWRYTMDKNCQHRLLASPTSLTIWKCMRNN